MGEDAHGAGRLNLPAAITAGSGWISGQLQVLSLADVAFVLAAFALIRASSRLGMWAYALFALPGTLAHELAHFLVALLLFANPGFPSLLPQRNGNSWRLGSVTFRAGMLRSVPIALAPLALAPLAVTWAIVFMVPAHAALYAVHAWIVAALLSASLPSSADFKIAVPALILIAAIAGTLWCLNLYFSG